MSLIGITEIGINLHDFTNIDLYHQAIYCIRCSVYQERPNELSNAMPYIHIPLDATTKDYQSHHAETITVHSIKHAQICDYTHSFLSRAFYVRYSNEKIHLNDFVQFRIEQTNTTDETLYIDIDLMYCECSFNKYNSAKKMNQFIHDSNNYFCKVSTARLKLFNFAQGYHLYQPVYFVDQYLSQLNISLHIITLDVKPKYRPTCILSPLPTSGGKSPHLPIENKIQDRVISMTEVILNYIAVSEGGNDDSEFIDAANSLYEQYSNYFAMQYVKIGLILAEIQSNHYDTRLLIDKDTLIYTYPDGRVIVVKDLEHNKANNDYSKYLPPSVTKFGERLQPAERDSSSKISSLLLSDIQLCSRQLFVIWNQFLSILPCISNQLIQYLRDLYFIEMRKYLIQKNAYEFFSQPKKYFYIRSSSKHMQIMGYDDFWKRQIQMKHEQMFLTNECRDSPVFQEDTLEKKSTTDNQGTDDPEFDDDSGEMISEREKLLERSTFDSSDPIEIIENNEELPSIITTIPNDIISDARDQSLSTPLLEHSFSPSPVEEGYYPDYPSVTQQNSAVPVKASICITELSDRRKTDDNTQLLDAPISPLEAPITPLNDSRKTVATSNNTDEFSDHGIDLKVCKVYDSKESVFSINNHSHQTVFQQKCLNTNIFETPYNICIQSEQHIHNMLPSILPSSASEAARSRDTGLHKVLEGTFYFPPIPFENLTTDEEVHLDENGTYLEEYSSNLSDLMIDSFGTLINIIWQSEKKKIDNWVTVIEKILYGVVHVLPVVSNNAISRFYDRNLRKILSHNVTLLVNTVKSLLHKPSITKFDYKILLLCNNLILRHLHQDSTFSSTMIHIFHHKWKQQMYTSSFHQKLLHQRPYMTLYSLCTLLYPLLSFFSPFDIFSLSIRVLQHFNLTDRLLDVYSLFLHPSFLPQYSSGGGRRSSLSSNSDDQIKPTSSAYKDHPTEQSSVKVHTLIAQGDHSTKKEKGSHSLKEGGSDPSEKMTFSHVRPRNFDWDSFSKELETVKKDLMRKDDHNLFPVAKKVELIHLLYCQHGLQGSSYDLRIWKNVINNIFPGTNCYCLSSNEGFTEDSILLQCERLVREIENETYHHFDDFFADRILCLMIKKHERVTKEFVVDFLMQLKTHMLQQEINFKKIKILKKLSLVGHSLGGLVVRAAVPFLPRIMRDRLGSFMSISSPHLGVSSSPTRLVGLGLLIVKQVKHCESLSQMSHSDGKTGQNFLFYLAHNSAFSMFEKVLLLSSQEDAYVPSSTARVELRSANVKRLQYFEDLDTLKPVWEGRFVSGVKSKSDALLVMGKAIFNSVNTDNVTRVDVKFNFKEKSMDVLVGRAAHIKFLDDFSIIYNLVNQFHYLFN